MVSSAPPAPGLSPESEIQKGRAVEATAWSRHSSKVPVGATNSNSCRFSHTAVASSRAAASTASAASPKATIAALQRGWSAQAKPIQYDTSVTPSRSVSPGIRAYSDLAGSMRVEVFSPGSRIGTCTSALWGRGPPSRTRAAVSARSRIPRSRVSQASMCGAWR